MLTNRSRGIIKKLIIFPLLLSLFLLSLTPVNAMKKDNEDFFDQFYSGKYKVYVENENRKDVTENFLINTKPFYLSNNISRIKDKMVEERLTLHIYQEQENPVTVYASEKSKNVDDTFFKIYEDKKYHTRMEFGAVLSGTIWYNPNTKEVTKTSNAKFEVRVMNVPLNIVPFCNDIQVSSNVSGKKGYFRASYKCVGQAYAGSTGTIALTYDYGSHTVSFYGEP